MDYQEIYNQLKTEFPKYLIYKDHPLAPHTTLKIGGPADIFINTTTSLQFLRLLKFLSKNKFSNFTILGNGSNVLISDDGIRGIVIKNNSKKIKVVKELLTPSELNNCQFIDTHRTENEPGQYLDFANLDYDETGCPNVYVRIYSGVFLPYTINYLIDHQITGLQWFSYIPGTIGGAVWYNIHGGKYHLSDFIESVSVFNFETGKKEVYKKEDLNWGYDKSVFQTTPNLIILSVVLKLFRGDATKAKITSEKWIQQKSLVQATNSAGSVFKNPSLEECQKIWGEQKSAGWIIDHELNLKGKSVGDAQISPKHGNFIVNNGNATAQDYLNLVKLIQSETQKKFNLNLEPEVKLLGSFEQ